jgi:hypothetical protein
MRAAAIGIHAAQAVVNGEQVAIDPKLFENG